MIAGLKEVLAEGRARGIGVANINTPNLETLLAALATAEKLNVPLIIAHAQLHEEYAPLDQIGRVMVTLARASTAKVCVHLDHGEDFDYCKRAIALGFTSIMIDYSTLPYEENVKGTREVVEYAHAHGVDVESELGAMPAREGGGECGDVRPEDLYTKPELVADYIARTGIDALAIAFGTAHGIYKSKPVLNMDIIDQVRAITDIPLVMHGGSGVSFDEYREVIRRGINKINYYTYMSYEAYETAKKIVEKVPADFYHVIALEAQKTMQRHLEKVIGVFAGK